VKEAEERSEPVELLDAWHVGLGCFFPLLLFPLLLLHVLPFLARLLLALLPVCCFLFLLFPWACLWFCLKVKVPVNFQFLVKESGQCCGGGEERWTARHWERERRVCAGRRCERKRPVGTGAWQALLSPCRNRTWIVRTVYQICRIFSSVIERTIVHIIFDFISFKMRNR
jgi:hypothetical protein